jgi:hypothetical protein
MVLKGETRMYRFDGRHSIYVPAGLVNDSAFPFTLDERLAIRIDGKKLVLEKA